MNFFMIAALTTILLSLSSIRDTCKIGKDTLTGRMIHFSADGWPDCAGGQAAIMRGMNKLISASHINLTNEINTRYVVAFIVETDGRITGMRISPGGIVDIDKHWRTIVQGWRWHPAVCQGRKVAMLVRYPMIIEFGTE